MNELQSSPQKSERFQTIAFPGNKWLDYELDPLLLLLG